MDAIDGDAGVGRACEACDGSLSEPFSLSSDHAPDVRTHLSSSTGGIRDGGWSGAAAQEKLKKGTLTDHSQSKGASGFLSQERSGRSVGIQASVYAKPANTRVLGAEEWGPKATTAMSPALERAEEIQRVLQEARAARAAAEQTKWMREKLAEPQDWKSIVRLHLGANGNKVDEIRVAREAWMLERTHGSTGIDAQGKLYSELQEMRQILSSIARTLPPSALNKPLGSQKSGSPQQHELLSLLNSTSGGALPPTSPMKQYKHLDGPELVKEVEKLYKKLYGLYPSRQSLINFCAETLRINIRPYLPAPPPPAPSQQDRSRAQRSLSELKSGEDLSDMAGEICSQCSICGSPLAKKGRGEATPPNMYNTYNSALSPPIMSNSNNRFLQDMSHDASPSSSAVLSREGSVSRADSRTSAVVPSPQITPFPSPEKKNQKVLPSDLPRMPTFATAPDAFIISIAEPVHAQTQSQAAVAVAVAPVVVRVPTKMGEDAAKMGEVAAATSGRNS